MLISHIAKPPRISPFLKTTPRSVAMAERGFNGTSFPLTPASRPLTHSAGTTQKRSISSSVHILMTNPYLLAACVPLALYTADSAREWAQRHMTPNSKIQPIAKPKEPLTQFNEQNLKQSIQKIFSSPETLLGFNQIIEGLSNKEDAKSPSTWIGKGACGNMSILVSIILKHMGLSPKIVGIMEDLDLTDIYIATWHSSKAPRHVWVEIDTIGNKKLENPLWIDLTCRQFTGTPSISSTLDVPHGLIGFKDEFLHATGPHRQHWEYEKNMTDFFDRYVTQLETELYHEIQTHDLSFLAFPFMATQNVQNGLRTLLSTLTNQSNCLEPLRDLKGLRPFDPVGDRATNRK